MPVAEVDIEIDFSSAYLRLNGEADALWSRAAPWSDDRQAWMGSYGCCAGLVSSAATLRWAGQRRERGPAGVKDGFNQGNKGPIRRSPA